MVNEGVVQADTRKVAKDTFIAEFTPHSAHPHVVQLEFNNIALHGTV